ncbi:hypothetical protein [Virgibacillus indicus]|uniref:hypothetical protein n=1 Tax=Virgibacillus indicus TaxID=2024554 RepID=UPI0013FE1B59|nr:hypothetical protein [Virgibacillus indicus]
MFEEVEWKDIYIFWKLLSDQIEPELIEPVSFKHIKFRYANTDYRIYGYDWLRKNEYDGRIHHVTNDSFHFIYYGKSLNKGTLQTAKYLVEAKDDPELSAAIWLYSFVKDILNDLPVNLRGKGYRCLTGILVGILSKLKENNMFRNYSMRRLLPEQYFSYAIDDLDVKGYESIVELAVINAKLIKSNYIIVLYDSYN